MKKQKRYRSTDKTIKKQMVGLLDVGIRHMEEKILEGYVCLSTGKNAAETKKNCQVTDWGTMYQALKKMEKKAIIEIISAGGIKVLNSFCKRTKFFRVTDLEKAQDLRKNLQRKLKISSKEKSGLDGSMVEIEKKILNLCLKNIRPETNNWFIFKTRDPEEMKKSLACGILVNIRNARLSLEKKGLIEFKEWREIGGLDGLFEVTSPRTGMLRIKDKIRARQILESEEPGESTANNHVKELSPLLSVSSENIEMMKFMGNLFTHFTDEFCGQMSVVLAANQAEQRQSFQQMLNHSLVNPDQRERIERLEQELVNLNDYQANLEKLADERMVKITELKEFLRSQNVEFKEQTKALRVELLKMSKKNQNQKGQLEALYKQIDSKKRAEESLMRDLSVLEKENATLKNNIRANGMSEGVCAAGLLAEKNREIKDLNGRLAAKDRIIAALQKEKSDQQKKIDDLQEENSGLMMQIVVLRGEKK